MGWAAAVGARGQTITQPEPPPGDPLFYGPLDGVAAVKSAATPSAVTDPGGGVSFTTRSDLQTKIDSNPANTIFVHASGGTEAWTTQIDCGTKNPRIYFLGLAGSTATIIDGQHNNINGFSCTAGTGFEIHGGKFTGFGNAADVGGATQFRAARLNGPGLIEDIEATDCHIGLTVTADADNSIVRRCNFHTNHRYGMNQTGGNNVLLARCRIRNNNRVALDVGDGGGTKFSGQFDGMIARYNYVDDNYGEGLWSDGGNSNMQFLENVTEDNTRSGIFYEIGLGGCVISRNAMYRDAEANAEGVTTRHTATALLVSESDGTQGPGTGITVTRNIIDTAKWPIMLFDTDNRAIQCRDVEVIENDVWLRANNSRVGGDDVKATRTMHTDSTFAWTSNKYHVLSNSNIHWFWPTSSFATIGHTFSNWEALTITSGESRLLI